MQSRPSYSSMVSYTYSSDTTPSDKKDELSSSSSAYFCPRVSYDVVNVYEDPKSNNQQVVLFQAGVGSDCSNMTVYDECVKNVNYSVPSNCEMTAVGSLPINPYNTTPFAGSINLYDRDKTDKEYVCGFSTVMAYVGKGSLNPTTQNCSSTTLINGMDPYKQTERNCSDIPSVLIAAGVATTVVVGGICYLSNKLQSDRIRMENARSTAAQGNNWCRARLFNRKPNENHSDVSLLDQDHLACDESGPSAEKLDSEAGVSKVALLKG